MAWQDGITAGTSAYRDFLTSLVAFATSKHVSALAVNAGGSGYTDGDVLTLTTHAGGFFSCRFVVNVTAGAVSSVRLIERAGAYSNRIATVAVNAGGSGYAVNDILEVQGGTSTEKGKAKVTSVSAGAVTGVSLFETGGAYSVAPGLTGATTTKIGPAAGSGTGCTLDLTMTGLIGTTGIGVTGGTGTGATFNLTLTDTGWNAQRNKNDFTVNSITDEKEVILLGTVAGGDAPYVGFFSFTQTSGIETRYGIACFGMTAFNSALTLASQPGIGPVAGVVGSTSGSHIPIFEGAREWWLSISARKIAGVIRTTNVTVAYASFYIGLMNGFGSATTSPYPFFVGASSNTANQVSDNSNLTGLAECFRATSSGSGPMYFRRKSDGVWTSVINGQDAGTPVQQDSNVMFPLCTFKNVTTTNEEMILAANGATTFVDGKIGSNTRANPTVRLFPAPDSGDDFFTLIPLTVIANNGLDTQSVNLEIAGELDGAFWFGGTKADGTTVSPEDFFETSGASRTRYRIFPNGTQGVSAKPYQFFCLKEA